MPVFVQTEIWYAHPPVNLRLHLHTTSVSYPITDFFPITHDDYCPVPLASHEEDHLTNASLPLCLQSYYCSNHDGNEEFGDLTLMLNCFSVASNAAWFPEKYADTALWNRSSCLCITFICEHIHKSLCTSPDHHSYGYVTDNHSK
jgi:hypothetical protein